MSTFGGISTAYSGLQAARLGFDVVGQNIANANTEGYTRQRVDTAAVGATSVTGRIGSSAQVGDGVRITGITRIGDAHLDARVNIAAGSEGYASTRASALSTLESTLGEPLDGLSARLTAFYNAWSDLANDPGDQAASATVLQNAKSVVETIATGAAKVSSLWEMTRSNAASLVDEVNRTAQQIATLNTQISTTLTAGGNANALIDQRAGLATSLAQLTGATVRQNDNGSIDVTLSGDSLVQGSTARQLQLTGGHTMADATGASPLKLEFTHRPGESVALSGGEVAGALSLLSAGGAYDEMAKAYANVATSLATSVNAIHSTGASTTGATGMNFFSYDPADPAATLAVVPTSASGIATGETGKGALDGSIAARIATLGAQAGSASAIWSAAVVTLGTTTSAASTAATLATAASASAVADQKSVTGVDIDEENVNLMQYQTSYQAAARVLTAIDEMLDVLINKTGVVGR